MTPEDQPTSPPADVPAQPAPEPHPADPAFDAQHGIRRPVEGVRIFDPDNTGSKAFG